MIAMWLAWARACLTRSAVPKLAADRSFSGCRSSRRTIAWSGRPYLAECSDGVLHRYPCSRDWPDNDRIDPGVAQFDDACRDLRLAAGQGERIDMTIGDQRQQRQI